MGPQLVLQEALVRILDVLRQVAEERKCRKSGRKLGDVLDFHHFALVHRRRVVLYFREHGIHEGGSGEPSGIVLVNVRDFVHHVQNPLLLQH